LRLKKRSRSLTALVAGVLLFVGCSSSTGPSSPPSSIAGSWTSDPAGTTMVLADSSNIVTGTGVEEFGFTVTGQYNPPNVELTFVAGGVTIGAFSGRAVSKNELRLSGGLATDSVTFVRQF
jgi:hypothetical protein